MTRERTLNDCGTRARDGEAEDREDAAVFVTKLIERSRDTLVTAVTTISRPAAELYRFWREISNLPQIIAPVCRVVIIDGKRSWWSSSDREGNSSDWLVSISHDDETRFLAWTTDRHDLLGSGRVEFQTLGPRTTKVVLTLLHKPMPGAAEKLLGTLQHNGPVYDTCNALRRLQGLVAAA